MLLLTLGNGTVRKSDPLDASTTSRPKTHKCEKIAPKTSTRATLQFGVKKSTTFCQGWVEIFAATLRLGGDDAAAWCGPERACGSDFLVIFGGDLGLWLWKRREDAGNRSQTLSGCVRDACGALVRGTARPGLQNLQISAKIRELQSNPLLRLS